jgi:propanol-preferring alcohol dehydrogenase
LRVRVGACAICRTDLHVVEEDLPPGKRPLVPGHQIVGVVDQVGAGCSRFGAGDRVGIAWLRSTCGTCERCRSREENLCEEARFTGHHEDGGYAELAVVPEEFAYAIPKGFSDQEAAPLLCAGLIGFRALRRSEVRPGGKLGIFGFGSSAHVTIQVALHWGCEVFVFTRGENRQAQARRMGAAWTGPPADPSPALLDGAILFAPAGALVPPALRSLRRGGTLAIAGIHLSRIPEMDYEPHLFYEKSLTSVTANTRRDGEDLLREAAAIPIRPTIRSYDLSESNWALLDLKEGRLEGTGVLEVRGSG